MSPILRGVVIWGALCTGASALAQPPTDPSALIKSAVAMDLDGHYADARGQLTTAIGLATSDSLKTRARRTLAVSYAFTCDMTDAAAVEHQIIDPRVAGRDFTGAADVDNELARILLECGDL